MDRNKEGLLESRCVYFSCFVLNKRPRSKIYLI